MGWWRVKVSSGCPLAGRLAAVEQEAQAKATAATARDRSRGGEKQPAEAPEPARRVATPDDRPPAPWGNFPLAELVDPRRHRRADRRHRRPAPDRDRASASPWPASAAWRSRSASTSPATAPTRPCWPGAVFVFTVGGLFYVADQILAVALGGRRGRLRDRLLPGPPRIPARLRRPQLPGRRNARLSAGSRLGAAEPSAVASRPPVERDASSVASSRRWREVSVPSCLFSFSESGEQELAGAGAAPAALAGQQLGDGHALGLPRAVADHLRGVRRPPALSRASARRGPAAPGWLVRVPACAAGPPPEMRSSLRVPSRQRPLGLLPSRNRLTGYLAVRSGPPASGPWPGSDRVSIRPPRPGCSARGPSYAVGVAAVNPRPPTRPPARSLRATISALTESRPRSGQA